MAQTKRKIICVIPSLASGGAEKVMLTLLENFDREKFELALVLFERKGKYLDMIPNDVRVIVLGKKSRFDFLGLVNKAKRLFSQERPDVIMSFLWYSNVVTLLARRFSNSNAPVIIGIRNVMSMFLKTQRLAWCKRLLMRKIYPMADAVIVLSNTMLNDMAKNFNVQPSKMRIILNPKDIKHIESMSAEDPQFTWFSDNIPVILSVGRLHEQKDYPTLLKAFAELQKKGEFRLVILGEGDKREELENLIKKLRISESVKLAGFVKNPYAYMKRADLFVMSSIHEGLPGALIEAMICGAPVVACACPSVAEVVADNVNGLLTPIGDASALSSAIWKVLNDKALGKRLARQARLDSERYSVKKIVSEYEDMLYEMSNGK